MPDWLRLIIKVAVIAAVAVVLLVFVGTLHRVSGNEMYPALKDGDLCITYKLEPYNVGDVVVYEMDGETHVARVAAINFDSISVTDAGVELNNGLASEEVFYETHPVEGGMVSYPYSVMEDEVFVLNDYRLNTHDSREFGAVAKPNLKGKLIFALRRRGF